MFASTIKSQFVNLTGKKVYFKYLNQKRSAHEIQNNELRTLYTGDNSFKRVSFYVLSRKRRQNQFAETEQAHNYYEAWVTLIPLIVQKGSTDL